MTLEHTDLVREYLILGNRYRRLVKIRYQYLDKTFNRTEREGYVQPIKFDSGREGLHILTWDVEKKNYRRFVVSNILEVNLTDIQWEKMKTKSKVAK